MKPGRELNTIEDLEGYLIAEGETAAPQELRQVMERSEGFDLDNLILSLAKKENDEEGNP